MSLLPSLSLGLAGGGSSAPLNATTPLTSNAGTVVNFGQGSINTPTENQIGGSTPAGTTATAGTSSALEANLPLILSAFAVGAVLILAFEKR